MVASEWNTNYDLLYNELNGNLNDANFKASGNIQESKFLFTDVGHSHTSIEQLDLPSLDTAGVYKGDLCYFNGSVWARIGTGANNTELTISYGANVVLVCKFNSTDGATSYTTETGQTVTFVGASEISTNYMKFGGSSLLLSSAGDYVTVPDSVDWYFGTSDFTIDMWVRFSNISSDQAFAGQYKDNDNFWYVYKPTNNKLSIYFINGGVEIANYIMTDTWSLSANTCYHLAFVRNGTTAKIFIDGISQTLTENVAFGTGDVGNIAADLAFGALAGGNQFIGYMDEIRIIKGLAQWTSDFTPPTIEYSLGLVWI